MNYALKLEKNKNFIIVKYYLVNQFPIFAANQYKI
jgi:hypothetical protein